jgi:hypothetical protein
MRIKLFQLASIFLIATTIVNAQSFDSSISIQEAVSKGVYYTQGVDRNPAEAIRYFKIAANQGSVKAQNALGIIYSSGELVPINEAEAAKWFRMAAESGDAGAEVTYASCLIEGSGVTKNPTEAVTWYLKSAMQGNRDALFSLGRCYGKGEGVNQDLVQSYKYIGMAAKLGDQEAKAMVPILTKNMTPNQISLAQKDLTDLAQTIRQNN